MVVRAVFLPFEMIKKYGNLGMSMSSVSICFLGYLYKLTQRLRMLRSWGVVEKKNVADFA